jgi:hypothetical protein
MINIHHSQPYSYGDSAGITPDFPFNHRRAFLSLTIETKSATNVVEVAGKIIYYLLLIINSKK